MSDKNVAGALLASLHHISFSDCGVLNEETEFSIAKYDYGYYLFLPEKIDESDKDQMATFMKYSPAFRMLVGYAIKMNCLILNIDWDNDEIPGLPVFEWGGV